MTVLIFLQGTLIMHKGAIGKTREEIVQQVKDKEVSVRDYSSYVPIGNAVFKLNTWIKNGARVCYLSSLMENECVHCDEQVLDRYSFPKGKIYHHQPSESYANVVSKMNPLPDVLIEDDCESIGGEKERTYPNLPEKIRHKIKPYVVKEFSGIDHLPDLLPSLY